MPLPSSESRATGPASAEQCDSSDEEDGAKSGAEAEEAGGAQRAPQRSRQSKRPCKSKRIRFKVLVDKLEAQVKQDPYNFVLNEAALPSSVLANHRFLEKLKERLAALGEQLRAERGSAASSSHEPASGSMKMSL